MYDVLDNKRTHRYVIKKVSDGKFDSRDGPGSLTRDINYTFVDKGFFDTLVWPTIPFFIVGHSLFFYGIYVIFTQSLWQTWIVGGLLKLWGMIGLTAGTHRLWTHRGYEARLPWRMFLSVGHILSGLWSIYSWCWGHRLHHKVSDTDADPHNHSRGLFFSHFGWLFRKEHPLVELKSKTIDCTDLWNDRVVRFQYNYFALCFAVIGVIIPTAIPVYLFGESIINAFLVCVVMRLTLLGHTIAFIGSAAHEWGNKPYNENLDPVDNLLVAFATFGEGWHNYHHNYPWDYMTGEEGKPYNPAKLIIDVMHFLGQAKNCKVASESMIEKHKSQVRGLSHHG